MKPTLVWKTSRHSDGLQCVEVCRDGTDVLVRHSKTPTDGSLRFTATEWDAFVSGIRDGEQLP